MAMTTSTSKQCLIGILVLLNAAKSVWGGCPFQNPFWFYEKPVVVNVYDENGDMVANKLRVMWGRMENFKCVDYFQVLPRCHHYSSAAPNTPCEKCTNVRLFFNLMATRKTGATIVFGLSIMDS